MSQSALREGVPAVFSDVHHLPADEVVLLVESDLARGLSSEAAAERLRTFGPNRLPPDAQPGPLRRFLEQLHNPLIYVLLVSAVVTTALGQLVDASVIFGVVVVNAIVGFVQEGRAEAALAALGRMIGAAATVLRDGRRVEIDSADLVPGDVVLLASGDRVPADLRIASAIDLHVDESALTGEALPARKHDARLPRETLLADRANLGFSGTLVTRGRGVGVVVATGSRSELGRIHALVGKGRDLSTPLTRKIAAFSRMLTVGILGLACATFAAGLARGNPPGEVFLAAVALAVGAIPEGLPAAVTVILAIGTARMARRRAIVRRLPVVETLGGTTVICTDKTGTLTENRMTVRAIFAGGQRYTVSGTGHAVDGAVLDERGPVDVAATPALRECLVSGVLCNDARLVHGEERVESRGDPTEAALLLAAEKAELDVAVCCSKHVRIGAVPFESERRYMATLHDGEGGRIVVAKGAVERVLELCERELGPDGALRPLDRARILAEADAMAREGLRVLAFARGAGPPEGVFDPTSFEGRLVFLGLQAMWDPPREEAIRAVRACADAGIAVKMVTGDHAGTARAIAARLGLGDAAHGEPSVLTGAELAELPEDAWPDAAERTSVFARVSPDQKLHLVEALHRRGHIVAMTGDGVNDAPALRRADVGVAMGAGGTEVAKDAADIVLTDDDFATIEAAVEEGRCVFDNLAKFLVWTLPTNMGEGFVLVVAIAAGLPLPILPVQILWINMTTAVALGLTLAFEPREAGLMRRPPRDPARPLLTGALVMRVLFVSALLLGAAFGLYEWELRHGSSVAVARTVAVNVFVFVELFYLFNCRSLDRSIFSVGFASNPWALVGVGTMILLELAITYVPTMNRLFHTAPIDAGSWARILAASVVAWVLVEIEKALRRRFARQSFGTNP